MRYANIIYAKSKRSSASCVGEKALWNDLAKRFYSLFHPESFDYMYGKLSLHERFYFDMWGVCFLQFMCFHLS